MPVSDPRLDGPIPGENFTSDIKNYPWHRSPQYDDMDMAIEAAAKQLMSKNGSVGIIGMMKMGVDVASLTDMFVTSGIGAGKWTPDFAILMAGPVSQIIYMMGANYGLKPKLGIDNDFKGPTASVFEAFDEPSGPTMSEMFAQQKQPVIPEQPVPEEAVEEEATPEMSGGFMGEV